MTSSALSSPISDAPPAWAAADWNALRAAGLAYVEQYGHALWTDYNRHDPGVTILELLCYAITDLSQRTSLEVKDLLRSSYGTDAAMKADFLVADQALPTTPVTALDYRKVLLDVKGVRNAWLTTFPQQMLTTSIPAPAGSPPLLPAAVYTPPAPTNGTHLFTLQGLYTITVDLDPAEVDRRAEELLNPPVIVYRQENNGAPGVVGGGGGGGPVLTLEQRQTQARNDLREEVRRAYLDQRNLGEDCVDVVLVTTQAVPLYAEIDLTPDADVTAVHAQLLLAIDQYLAPVVKRYSLAEMQALRVDGHPLRMDQIFEGPRLEKGFIRDIDLAESELRTAVYASDIIALAMALPGVTAVRNLTLKVGSSLDTAPALPLRWEFAVPTGRAQLVPGSTALHFYQGTRRVSTAATKTAAGEKFEDLRAALLEAQARTVPTVPVPVPVGTAYDLAAYRPLALDFPATYGIGPAGLPADAPIERRNQARQLQAYLLFFDQLLANYLAQLLHVKDLLGTNPEVPATYFGQVLDRAALPELAQLHNPDLTLTPQGVALAGPAAAEMARKNRFLDHLLGRFAESFTEYGLLLYAGQAQGPRPDGQELLVKTRLAHDLGNFHPARAFRYHAPSWLGDDDTAVVPIRPVAPPFLLLGTTPPEIIPPGVVANDAEASENVAGIVRRFGRLLGMTDYRARWAAAAPYAGIQLHTEPSSSDSYVPGRYTFTLRGPIAPHAPYATSPPVIYSPTAGQTSAALAQAAAQAAQLRALRHDAWTVEPSGPAAYRCVLRNATGGLLAYGPGTFATPAAAEAYLAQLLNLLHTAEETILVVEHLLLRPTPADATATLVLQDQWLQPASLAPCTQYDPYSYCVTVVLPDYAPRFDLVANADNLANRTAAERILRAELPAHIMAHICWVSRADLSYFEQVYHDWLAYKRDPTAAPSDLSQARGRLVGALNDLHMHYLPTEFSDNGISHAFTNGFSLGFS